FSRRIAGDSQVCPGPCGDSVLCRRRVSCPPHALWKRRSRDTHIPGGGQNRGSNTGAAAHFHLYLADWLRVRRREATRDALCDVDVAGGARPGCHRRDPVFHSARSAAFSLPSLQHAGSVKVYVLPALRNAAEADVPAVREGGLARMDQLRKLRSEASIDAAAHRLSKAE